MSTCIFCKIVNGGMKADVVYEDDEVLAFRDINPQAPVHILLIPKKHISTMNDLGAGDERLIGKLFSVAKSMAVSEQVAESGYRVVMNCNRHGGQSVYHIHLHLLGGRFLTWPPG